MLRFHYAIAGGPLLNIYEKKRLIISSLSPFETSQYVSIQGRSDTKITAIFSTNSVMFLLKLSICADSSYTVVLSLCDNKQSVTVYKDDHKEPPQGKALLRKIFSNSMMENECKYESTKFSQTELGIQTITMNNMSTTVDIINQGIYTVFFDSPSNISAVLYNNPDQYQQCPLEFQDYIGDWNVVSSIGISSSIYSYNFSETTQGKFMIAYGKNSTPAATNVPTDTTFLGNITGITCEGFVIISGFFSGNMSTTTTETMDEKVPFSWIVHETDYKSYSLNGSPNRQRLVILSRCNSLEHCIYKKLVKKAKQLGYDISKLQIK